MPSNVFVTEYRTNWIAQLTTNVVEVYRAIWRTKMLTNIVPVEIVQTNQVVAFQTNRKTLTLTNWETVLVMQTNWVQQPVTNVVEVCTTNWVTWTFTKAVPVEMVRTNMVLTYQTNWRTLNVTNLETVVIMQTNSVRKQVTNVVEIEMITNRPAENEMAGPKLEPAEAVPALATAEGVDDYVLETARTGKPAANNQVEVLLKMKSAGDPSASLEVQNWRVERADRAILLFGQDSEFKRALPMGTYSVQAKVRTGRKQPVLNPAGDNSGDAGRSGPAKAGGDREPSLLSYSAPLAARRCWRITSLPIQPPEFQSIGDDFCEKQVLVAAFA